MVKKQKMILQQTFSLIDDIVSLQLLSTEAFNHPTLTFQQKFETRLLRPIGTLDQDLLSEYSASNFFYNVTNQSIQSLIDATQHNSRVLDVDCILKSTTC